VYINPNPIDQIVILFAHTRKDSSSNAIVKQIVSICHESLCFSGFISFTMRVIFAIPLSRLVFVDWRRLMGLTTSHCVLRCVALMVPCAINNPWCSEVLLKLKWVCKVKHSSWFPPDWIRCWRYNRFHPRWRSNTILFWKSLTWPKKTSVTLPNSAPERLIMNASLFKPAIRRSEISLPGDFTLMSLWRWNSSRCRLRTMRFVVPLASEGCLTIWQSNWIC